MALTVVGAAGGAAGVTEAEAEEAEEFMFALEVATAVKVYAVPLVRPVTTHEVVEVVQVNPPGDEVTKYEDIVAPATVGGAVQEIVEDPLPATPTTFVGVPG
jgi:hypothetical protein